MRKQLGMKRFKKSRRTNQVGSRMKIVFVRTR